MALAVVHVAPAIDNRTAVVTLQSNLPGSDAITELQSTAAKHAAIGAAAKQGVADPRVGNLHLAPYAVDPQGQMVERPLEQKVAAYRVDIEINTK